MKITHIEPIRRTRYKKEGKDERESPYRQYGTDAQFRRFLRDLPCAICGLFRAWVDGKGQSESAHIRLDGVGGTAYKPPYSAIPLCRVCHAIQHTKGHLWFGNREFWIMLKKKYLQLWVKHRTERI